MFEPEIFQIKFKVRLFYLAYISQSSHPSEGVVAALVKRLALISSAENRRHLSPIRSSAEWDLLSVLEINNNNIFATRRWRENP